MAEVIALPGGLAESEDSRAGTTAAADLALVVDGSPQEALEAAPSLAAAQDLRGQEVAVRPQSAVARAARLLVASVDALTVAGSMAVAFALRAALYVDTPVHGAGAYRRLGMVTLPLWLVVFSRYRLYNARHVTCRRDEVVRIVHAVGVSVLMTALVAYFLDLLVARSWFLLLFVAATAAVLLEREVVRQGFALLRRRGHSLRPVAIAGTGAEALALARMLREKPELGYRVVSLVGDPHAVEPEVLDEFPVLEAGTKVAEQVRLAGAAGVIVATTDVDLQTSNRLIRSLTDAGIHVELSSSLMDIDATRLSVRPLGCVPVLYVEPVKRDGWRPAAKRAFDVVVSTLILVASLPALALATLAIKVTSPGPVLFRQTRVGKNGRPFQILKLRSMYVDANERLRALVDELPDGPVPKLRHDPRVTPVGRLLRKLSIDELPQLVNVLKGEMSLVGPRPEQPCEAELWTAEVYEQRTRVRPGLTGVWQVNGRSSARDTKDRWDLYYVDNWSVWRDLAIMCKTIPVVLCSKGAY